MNEIITEEYSLPSGGLIYSKPFDPEIKLRSMTVAEEMKRQSPSRNPYKAMSEIIEDCLLTKLPISVYDLCLGDYIYLLQKLRVVTYGSEYSIPYICPKCGSTEEVIVNLDDIEVFKYDKEIEKLKVITLPRSEKVVKLRFQTPRDLDKIEQKKRELKEKFPEMKDDPTTLLNLESLIDTVDDEPLDPIMGREALKQLPAMDMRVIEQSAVRLQNSIGVNGIVNSVCSKCGYEGKLPFRYTSEFFRPEIY